MKRILICEGKTDAILFGYFLSKTRELQYTSNHKSIILPVTSTNQTLSWYKKNGSSEPDFAIWSVGGFDNMQNAVKEIVQRNKLEHNPAYRFRKILIIVDMDDIGVQPRIESYRSWLNQAGLLLNEKQAIKIGEWYNFRYHLRTTKADIENLQSSLFVIPENTDGCLETFLLDSLKCDNEECNQIVTKVRSLIKNLANISFLKRRRFMEKAALGSTLSIIFPDWVFSEIDSKLQSIEWEKLSNSNNLKNVLDSF